MKIGPVIETQPAPIDAEIFRIEPPIVTVNHNSGETTAIHAAYLELETGMQIPVGSVLTSPSKEGIVAGKEQRPCTQVVGRVGLANICEFAVSHHYREFNVIMNYPAPDVARLIANRQDKSAYFVLTRLGLNADDIFIPDVPKVPTAKKRFGFGRNS